MNRKILMLSALFLPTSLACAITLFGTPAPPPSPQSVTQIVVIPADTSTLAPPTATTEQNNLPAAQVLSTFTAAPTASPTSTASPSSTPAFTGPVAKLIKDANCRKGPATSFDVVTSFLSGQVLQIVGRNPDLNNTWWQVLIPGTNSKCWISFVTAQATGDFDSIPIIHPPY